MLQKKFTRLDNLAGPSGYVVPPTAEDLVYVVHFRQICHLYNIDFAEADQDEREFVLRMAEKNSYPSLLTHNLTHNRKLPDVNSGANRI